MNEPEKQENPWIEKQQIVKKQHMVKKDYKKYTKTWKEKENAQCHKELFNTCLILILVWPFIMIILFNDKTLKYIF